MSKPDRDSPSRLVHHRTLATLALGALGAQWLMATPALRAQDTVVQRPHGQGHGAVLFVVQAEARSTVPPSRSEGSATGAFVVDVAKGSMAYDLTFEGLSANGPRAIALHNSGPGASGPLVRALCDSATPCPSSAEANLTGTRDRNFLLLRRR
jgi:hypothetical protein